MQKENHMQDDFESAGLKYAEKIFDEIREFSLDPVIGITRQGYSEKESRAHDYIKAKAVELGLETRVDAAGNLFCTLPGEDRSLPAYMTGSHADSVPQGGHYDGLAGVVAGLTVIWWLKTHNIKLKRDLVLVVFRLEESSFFGKAYIGSLAMTGRLTADETALKHRTKDCTLADEMRACGFNPDAVVRGEPTIDLKKIAAFTELHIEQGPTLDSHEKERAGIVTGIRGNLRHKQIKCLGVTAHSGAVDKQYRKDALFGFAELVSSMDKKWDERLAAGEDLVMTIGVCNTAKSAAISVIPGEVTFTLDIRSLSMDVLKSFYKDFRDECERISRERGLEFVFDKMLTTEPGRVDEALSDHIAEAAAKAGVPVLRLPSGAGHDSAVLGNAGIPVSMIFVANQDGSHNPYEKMKLEDFIVGARVLLEAVKTYDE